MKMNKLAAGALALALGLGAVAPAVAAEAKSGTGLIQEDYNEQLAKANKFYLKRKEAREAVEAAKARVKAAEAAVKAAQKVYDDAKDDKSDDAVKAAKEAYDKAMKAEAEAKEKAEFKGATQADKDAYIKAQEDEAKAKEKAEKPDASEADKKAYEDAKKATAAAKEKAEAKPATEEDKKAYEDAKKETEKAKERYYFLNKQKPSFFLNAEAMGLKVQVMKAADAVATATKAKADAKEGSQAKKDAEKALEKANKELLDLNAKYEEKLAELAKALEKEKLEEDNLVVPQKLSPKKQALVNLLKAQNELTAANGAYGLAVNTEKAAEKRYEVELNDLKLAARAAGDIVKIENDKIVVTPSIKDKEQFKKSGLEELKRAREEALTAIKAVKLLKELSPEKIKNVEAKLNALVAKNEELVKKADAKLAAAKVAFIATAYADEEADDTDALIKELDSTTSEIKELIKDKPEEKKEEEKKPEEKKEEKTPSKKAGNNARTGIAGVAGVAGILAAASVAYAASKRD